MRIKIPVIEFIPALLLGLINILVATCLEHALPHGGDPYLSIATFLVGCYVGYCLGRLAWSDGKPTIIQRRQR